MPKKITHPFLAELHTCLLCDAPLEASTNGRPRKFCSNAHRKTYNKKNSVKNIIKHYNSIATEFFATTGSDARQRQLAMWARQYALWCNGELPEFAKTKEALINAHITRPKVANEKGKSIYDRMIAYLRSLDIEDEKIYDRLSVVRAFPQLIPSPELLTSSDNKPATTSNVIPLYIPKAVIAPVLVVQPAPVAEVEMSEEDEITYLFADATFPNCDDEEAPAPNRTAQRIREINHKETNLRHCIREVAKSSKDRSNIALMKLIKEYCCTDDEYQNYVETMNGMYARGEVIETKGGSKYFYNLASDCAALPQDQLSFWQNGMAYLNRKKPNKDHTAELNNHFKSRFGKWASIDVKEFVGPIVPDNGATEAFIRKSHADYAKSKAAA